MLNRENAEKDNKVAEGIHQTNRTAKFVALEIEYIKSDLQLCMDVHHNALKLAQCAFDRATQLQKKLANMENEDEIPG